jgi:predicted RNA-binding Zn-ribbon protein involved in translation (DUF1610 family)
MIFCKQCGKEIEENSKFCGECGQDVSEHVLPVDKVPEIAGKRQEFVDKKQERALKKMKKSAIKCPKCGGGDLNISPKLEAKIQGAGCLSIAIVFSGLSLFGLVFFGYILYQIRRILLGIVMMVLYASVLRVIQGKPAGIATCQNCGKHWNVDKRGKTFKYVSLAKTAWALIFLALFIYLTYRLYSLDWDALLNA